MSTVEVRTYESFSIRWDRGSVWTSYTLEQAQATVAYAAKQGSHGTIERYTWNVVVRPEMAHLYQPGVSSEFIEVNEFGLVERV